MLSVVIPVYNSGEILFGTYENVKKELEKITDNYEILFRNDGSTDDSQEVLEKIAKKNNRVKIFLNENRGLGFVLRRLFKDASGDFIIYFDADVYLSFDLNVLPRLLEKTNNADVVVASRYHRNNKIPFYRLIPSLIYRFINRLLFGINISDTGSGFVIIKKKVLNEINLNSDGFDIHIEFYTEIKKAGFKIKEVPVKYSHWGSGSFKVLKYGPTTLINTLKFRLRE
jgi:glycosyltransferase involved in cell wall biosynthesis